MARKKKGTDSEITPEERLEKARARLRTAEDRYVETRQRGEMKVEKARQKADAVLSKAAERVQRRKDAVDRLEAQLGMKGALSDLHHAPGDAVADSSTFEPIASETVSGLNGHAWDAPNGLSGLRARELRALETLQALKLEGDGVTAQQWRALAGMSASTFDRARHRLVETGLVTTSNAAQKRARYMPATSPDGNSG
jgi:hypothetical protein